MAELGYAQVMSADDLRQITRLTVQGVAKGSDSPEALKYVPQFLGQLQLLYSLPAEFTADDIGAVMSVFLTLSASQNVDTSTLATSLQVLLSLIRGDKRVFNIFNPHTTSSAVQMLQLDAHAMQEDPALSQAALELISLLLRYYVTIDYTTFSTDGNFVKKVRRYEQVKQAKEME